MTKAELVEEVSRVSDLTKKHSEVIVDTVFQTIVDALHRVVLQYDYDMLGARVHSASMDGSLRWLLNDVSGMPLYTWNSRGHRLRATFDVLHRPLVRHLQEGEVIGRVKAGAMSFARFSTDDLTGKMRGYVGGGTFTSDPLETFGGAGVVEIPRLQELLKLICKEGFEHHAAMNASHTAKILNEAFTTYFDWDTYMHG